MAKEYHLTLPDDLRQALLSTSEPVCSALIVNEIASAIVKAPADDIASFRGPVPVLYRYELGRFETGSVIRLYLEIIQPPSPYGMETLLNPDSEHDLVLLQKLIAQEILDIHFFDMAVNYVFSKRVTHRPRQRLELKGLVDLGVEHLGGIPAEQLDWQAAKAEFQRRRPL